MVYEAADNLKRHNEEQKELSGCNFVKTVLMLTVVLYHSILYWNGTWFIGKPAYSAPVLSVAAQWMNTVHIYAFALVSGYLFYYLKFEKGKYAEFIPFVINKAKRLLLPYLFVSLVWVIPVEAYFFKYSVGDVLFKFALGIYPGQLWFLLMLFDVFIIFYPLSDFFRKKQIGGMLLAVAFYGVGFICRAKLPDIFQIFRAFTYIPMFWLGFEIRMHGSSFLRRIPAAVWIGADIFLFILLRALYKMQGPAAGLLRQGTYFLLCNVGALMAFFVLQKLADTVKWRQSKAFGILGKYSVPIYLFHQQVIYMLLYFLNGAINPYLHAGVNFLGSMLVSLLIAALLMRFKWTKYLIGEK